MIMALLEIIGIYFYVQTCIIHELTSWANELQKVQVQSRSTKPRLPPFRRATKIVRGVSPVFSHHVW